jgi:hypothetical protein
VQRQRLPHGWGVTVLAAMLLAAGCGGGAGVSFSDEVQPIFDRKCTSCHPVSYPYLDLRQARSYDELVRVSARTRPAFERVLPGRPELSYVLTHPPDPSLTGLLTDEELELIARWIDEGAKDN